MEWQDPAIVLETTPYGEGDALATVLTPHGAWRGLAKGGASRAKPPSGSPATCSPPAGSRGWPTSSARSPANWSIPAPRWRWMTATHLAILNAACALAAGALPEREPHPETFAGLTRLLAGIDIPGSGPADLDPLGAGRCCANSASASISPPRPAGANDRLAYRLAPHRPRRHPLRGRRMGGPPAAAAALSDSMTAEPTPADCLAGLRLTGHFLARDVFGARHRPLPPARARLYDLLAGTVWETEHANRS